MSWSPLRDREEIEGICSNSDKELIVKIETANYKKPQIKSPELFQFDIFLL